MILNKIQSASGKLGATLASFIKIPIMSRRPSPKSRDRKDTIIIMGNGPSLRDAMEQDRDVLMAYPRLAVNLSALTPGIYIVTTRLSDGRTHTEKHLVR